MFEKSKNITAAESDFSAALLFKQNKFKEALEQNNITRKIIGRDTPELAKNAAACYSRLFMPQQALNYFTMYMNLSESKSIEDVRQYADYMAQNGNLDAALSVTKTQSESFEKYHDLAMHAFRYKEYKNAFHLLDKGKRLGNILWIGQERFENLPKCLRWNGEDLSNKKICVVGECGLGDEFIFARWLPDLMRVADVCYYTNNTIKHVLHRNFGVKLHSPDNHYDFWIPSMSLPLALKLYDPIKPAYIKPSEIYMDKWKSKLTENMCVICWSGNKDFSQNHFRDIPIDSFIKKLKNKYEIVGVCKTDSAPYGIIDVSNQIESWEDTLAIMALSKLVISSCTSTAHAAGSMGVKTYVYTRPDDYFTWSATKSGETSEWYENTTVWRTKSIGKWETIIDDSFL